MIKSERFKPNLRHGEGACLLDSNWELLPQEKGLTAEGSASYPTSRNSLNHKDSTLTKNDNKFGGFLDWLVASLLKETCSFQIC